MQTEWIVVIVVAILLIFGPKKIPELMRGLGKGMREFKSALKGEGDNSESETKKGEEDKKKPDEKS
ncbi:MAG: twin-arginine translocase TatA/TatE family subunit [Candidatus Sumerlaeota bacterium]|nr:twin-arginine translocase TatA/TatE family subunit [Candidatus Sumerlaeota bacterium]